MANKVSRINRFILNTDFLTLAKNKHYERNIIIPAIELIDSGLSGYQKRGDASVDINMPTPAGAIARSSVTFKGNNSGATTVNCNGFFTIEDSFNNGLLWQIYWGRKNSTTITVYATVYQRTGYPAITLSPTVTFTLNVSYFYPPNI